MHACGTLRWTGATRSCSAYCFTSSAESLILWRTNLISARLNVNLSFILVNIRGRGIGGWNKVQLLCILPLRLSGHYTESASWY